MRRIGSIAVCAFAFVTAMAGFASLPSRSVQASGPSSQGGFIGNGYWVDAKDRLRLKMWNSSGNGANFQAKAVIKFIRAQDYSRTIRTVTKILTPGNDRGVSAQNGASFPFGAAGGWGRSVTDATTTATSGTIGSATAAFVAGDIGKQVTISGAATACSSLPCQGPNFPTTLYQGVITAVGGATSATVVPVCDVTTSGSTLKIEPVLLADDDGLELGDGWIMGFDVNFWQGSTKRGQAYFEGEINRISHTGHEGISLIKGYLESSNHLSWPYGIMEARNSGNGYLNTITVADPAAGSQITQTVPTNARWRIQSLRFALVTDATVANRFVAIRITDGTNIVYDASAQIAHTASLTWIYTAAAGIPYMPGAAIINSRQTIPLPDNLVLPAGYTIETSTTGFVAGDNFAVPFLLVEEWIG